MAAPDEGGGYSVTPTQRVAFNIRHASRKSDDLSSLQRPFTKDSRSLSGGSSHLVPKALAPSIASNAAPGSFSSELKSAPFQSQSRTTTPQNEYGSYPVPRFLPRDSEGASSEQRQAVMREKIAKEMKIKVGTENLLEALMSKNAKGSKDQRQKIEVELGSSNRKLADLKLELDQEVQRSQQVPSTPPVNRTSSYFKGSPLKSPPRDQPTETESPEHSDGESPTVVLTDTLQALEVEGMQPDYYIDRANTLVDLFKKNTTLKFDLAWSVFSLRVQVMLLSESSDVVAAGYRLTRHAIADRSSLQTIRSLHTDELVILSLVKKGKAILEREQAVKFVRAFLDVKNGVLEISRAVTRSLVAVAEHHDDRLKDICLLTLAEILTKHPALLVSANGMSTLTDALATGTFPSPEGLVAGFLHILDQPQLRRYLSTGREFEAMFAPFTDPLLLNGNEEKLKTCAKAISAMLKTWPGFLLLAERNAFCVRSLIDSLQYPIPQARDIVLELLFDILRIKPPSWSTTFLAGRRLTTYGRVNDQAQPSMKPLTAQYDPNGRFDLSYHFSAIVLATLIQASIVPALYDLVKGEDDPILRRKATLLLTEVLKMAQDSLPSSISARIQVLGGLLAPTQDAMSDSRSANMGLMYQIESINRTMNKAGGGLGRGRQGEELAVGPQALTASKYSPMMDGERFRQLMFETGVPSHASYIKWKWDLILGLIEGPLTNQKRLEDAIKSTKILEESGWLLSAFQAPLQQCAKHSTQPKICQNRVCVDQNFDSDQPWCTVPC